MVSKLALIAMVICCFVALEANAAHHQNWMINSFRPMHRVKRFAGANTATPDTTPSPQRRNDEAEKDEKTEEAITEAPDANATTEESNASGSAKTDGHEKKELTENNAPAEKSPNEESLEGKPDETTVAETKTTEKPKAPLAPPQNDEAGEGGDAAPGSGESTTTDTPDTSSGADQFEVASATFITTLIISGFGFISI